MLLTLVFEMDGERRPITFDGTPAECQAQANGFIGDGLTVTRVIIFGEK